MSTKPISPYYQDSILEITKLKAELESLRQENNRLREALEKWTVQARINAHDKIDYLFCLGCGGQDGAHKTNCEIYAALNPPKS